MLTLGDMLALSRRSAGALDVAGLPDDLRTGLEGAARAESMAAQDFLRVAVADFADFASPEDWTQLMSRLRDAPDAGGVCLQAMLRWRLRASGWAPQPRSAAERESAA